MNYEEFKAKTVDEAITKACIKYGVTSKELDYSVEDEGASGFLGIGSRAAVIKARPKSNESVDEAFEKSEKEAQAIIEKEKEAERDVRPAAEKAAEEAAKAVNFENEEPKAEEKKEPEPIDLGEARFVTADEIEKRAAAAAARGGSESSERSERSSRGDRYSREGRRSNRSDRGESRYGSRGDRRGRGDRYDRSDKSDRYDRSDRYGRSEGSDGDRWFDKRIKSRRSEGGRYSSDRYGDRGRREHYVDEVSSTPSTPKPEREVPSLSDEEIARITAAAEKFLGEVFGAMGAEVNLSTAYEPKDGSLNVTFEGDGMGFIIGKRGQTLDSLQYLTGIVVNKQVESYVRVKLDTEAYRSRRADTLTNLARNVAGKVKRSQRAIALEAMNPYERRIIHSALQKDPDVYTYSQGEEPRRCVVVAPKKS